MKSLICLKEKYSILEFTFKKLRSALTGLKFGIVILVPENMISHRFSRKLACGSNDHMGVPFRPDLTQSISILSYQHVNA